MVPARRVRTIKMCSLDARGEGPIQATLKGANAGAERAGGSLCEVQKLTPHHLSRNGGEGEI